MNAKDIINRLLQSLAPVDLEVIGWGPKGAVVIDRKLLKALEGNRETAFRAARTHAEEGQQWRGRTRSAKSGS
jgi:hypothetical protein